MQRLPEKRIGPGSENYMILVVGYWLDVCLLWNALGYVLTARWTGVWFGSYLLLVICKS